MILCAASQVKGETGGIRPRKVPGHTSELWYYGEGWGRRAQMLPVQEATQHFLMCPPNFPFFAAIQKLLNLPHVRVSYKLKLKFNNGTWGQYLTAFLFGNSLQNCSLCNYNEPHP